MDEIPPATRSSLLIDLEMGKRIEVEALQGAALRRAATHGLAMPIVATLYSVLRPYAAGPALRPA
jgi:2-dehydropantoate 2-reductase